MQTVCIPFVCVGKRSFGRRMANHAIPGSAFFRYLFPILFLATRFGFSLCSDCAIEFWEPNSIVANCVRSTLRFKLSLLPLRTGFSVIQFQTLDAWLACRLFFSSSFGPLLFPLSHLFSWVGVLITALSRSHSCCFPSPLPAQVLVSCSIHLFDEFLCGRFAFVRFALWFNLGFFHTCLSFARPPCHSSFLLLSFVVLLWRWFVFIYFALALRLSRLLSLSLSLSFSLSLCPLSRYI